MFVSSHLVIDTAADGRQMGASGTEDQSKGRFPERWISYFHREAGIMKGSIQLAGILSLWILEFQK